MGRDSIRKIVCLILLLFNPCGIWAAEPFSGTWKLVPAKSVGAIPKDEILLIETRGQQLSVEVKVFTSGPESRTLLIRFTAPVQGGFGHIEEGPYDGVMLKRVSVRVIEISYLTSGQPARSTRAVLSKDGQTIISTGAASDGRSTWTMVFRRSSSATH